MQNDKSKKRNLGARIKALAEQGLSYRKIEKKLGCSKGAIAYHLGKGQKKKALARQAKYKAKFQMPRDEYLERVRAI
jgi:DNA invertase Pin-like site-specific DNA recombinase|tara:strand:+ start:108 stop:338 length:231 start_codon:yes stop_codon:yes gene_type:complete